MLEIPGIDVDTDWTKPVPATRATAMYGLRRPQHNSYASIIHSQKTFLPTDPTRVVPRDACTLGCTKCGKATSNLESKESLCGECYQQVQGVNQPAWRYSYDDELAALLIDSEARDALIAQAYRDAANMSSQLPSQPVLCRALARYFNHDPNHRFRPMPTWSEEDWAVARWYSSKCYPFVTAAGSTTFYEPPLVRKEWYDNLFRQLSPALDSMGCRGLVEACPCKPTNNEECVYARKPTQMQIAEWERRFGQQYKEKEAEQQRAQLNAHYGLYPDSAEGNRLAGQQAAIVRDQAALRDHINGDYEKRLYDARVQDHLERQRANQQRLNSMLTNCNRCGLI